MDKQIGWYHLKEAKIFRNDFETAAWYEDVEIPAGCYPIMVMDYRVLHFDDEARARFNGQVEGHIRSVYVPMNGTIKSDNFQSLFYGMPIGEPYDSGKHAGKPARHVMQVYMYSVAESVLKDPETPYELFPEFEAREERGTYNGKEYVSHSIYVREDV